MKWIYGLGLAALLAGFLAASHAMMLLLTTYAPGLTPIMLLLDAHVIPKLAMLLCLMGQVLGTMAALLGLVLALTRQPGAKVIELILALAAGALVVLGLLGGLYDWTVVQQAIAMTGTTNPAVLAPSRAGILLTVSGGLLVGFILLAEASLIRLIRTWRKPSVALAPA